MYNEELVLPMFAERLRPVLDGLDETYEVVCVDDGSKDDTWGVLTAMAQHWPQLRLVRLRANSGHQAAISAGLARGRGRWLVTIDADLQDPPETIATMLDVAQRKGVDVVYGVRTDRSSDTVFKRRTAGVYYRLMENLGGGGELNAGDFRLMSREAVDAVLRLPEPNRVLRLVVPSLGFPSATVGYRREVRAAGESKYPLSKMMRLTADSITSVSLAPLRLAIWFGGLGCTIGILIAIWAVLAKILGRAESGWTSLVCVVALLGGLQLLCIGILGEYVGRIFSYLQARPAYHIAYDSADPDSAGSHPAAGLGSRRGSSGS